MVSFVIVFLCSYMIFNVLWVKTGVIIDKTEDTIVVRSGNTDIPVCIPSLPGKLICYDGQGNEIGVRELKPGDRVKMRALSRLSTHVASEEDRLVVRWIRLL